MKRFFAVVSILCAFAVSCSSDDSIQPPPAPELAITSTDQAVTIDETHLKASVAVGVDGTAFTIDVTTNLDAWTLSEPPAWIKVVRAAKNLTLTVEENETPQSRNATLTIKAQNETGSVEATVTVAQAGVAAPALAIASTDAGVTVDESGLEAAFAVTADGAAATFTVTTDLDTWTLSEAPSWIKAVREAKSLTLTVEKNELTQSRNAELTIGVQNVAGSKQASVKISQEGVPAATLDVTSNTAAVPAAGGNAYVDYTTNQTAIDINNGAESWLTVNHADGRITFSADANLTDGPRSGEVVITAGTGDNTATQKIAVSQEVYTQSLVFTTKTTTDNKDVMLPTLGSADAEISITVDWGDGSQAETFTSALSTANKHTYGPAGEYKVTITTRNVINAISFANGFSYVKSIDSNSLDMSGVKTLSRCFYQCRLLESVSADAFISCGNVTDASNLFYGCILLEGVPAGIFDNLKKVTSFDYCFQGATAFASVPAGLFANCSAATSFLSVFYQTAITELPSRCFAGCTSVQKFVSICNGCKKLTKIAPDAFEGCTDVTSFNGAFSDCSALTSIPENLFAPFTKLSDMSYCFARCGLTSLPASLFDNNRVITDFDFCFQKCTELTGESPYTMIDGAKVHLYERQNYPESFIAPKTFDYCFTADEGLTDYPVMRQLTGAASWWAKDY